MDCGVILGSFAERHFVSSFLRKYKGAWNLTWGTISDQLKKIEVLFPKNIAQAVTDKNATIVICKTEFKIAGTQESRHGSGNRCIVAWHKDACEVRVLLVYGKTDLSGHNETAEWKALIKENYPEYCDLL
jgi:hypothetical protein